MRKVPDETKKLLLLMLKLPDETKKLLSDTLNSGSTPISDKTGKKKKEKTGHRTKGVVKAAAVKDHARKPLAGIELMVSQLNHGQLTDAVVVDASRYDDLVGLIICAIENSAIPKSVVPDVPEWFFLADTGSGVHLG